jgi:hypothetical protein
MLEDVKRYNDEWARRIGYKDHKHYQREWVKNNRHEIGESLPMEVNNRCSSNLGVYKSETIFKEFLQQVVFDNVISTGYQDGGIDFYCRNPIYEFVDRYSYLNIDGSLDKEYRVQLTTRCITFDNKCDWSGWKYFIDHNAKPDIWILCAYDNLSSLDVLHTWMFNRKNKVRKGRGNYKFEEFWRRSGFSISNNPKGISQLKQFELKEEDLDRLNDICSNMKKML